MKYFTIKELCKSDTANKLGIKNEPNKQELESLTNLVNNILDPLREAWGRPITVNSGYRCDKLNKAVKGKSTSQHMKGEAVDITTNSKEDNAKLYQLAINLKLPFDQLINEKGFTWIHISHRAINNRNMIFGIL